ncbi:MAG: AbrB/MazE/SpoVT family DNA-binding domain-containing protein [Kiritimatiellaeota bacterium]|nr:AbrB/MazE/SpoVT family DNA-binding domain-containing protein [Kiritimatiellota bacterium]
MTTATLTTKGQVTIPKSVRDSLHLHAGDRIEFVVRDASEAILRPITKSVDEVFGKLHAPGQFPMTVEQMDAAVAKRFRNHRR